MERPRGNPDHKSRTRRIIESTRRGLRWLIVDSRPATNYLKNFGEIQTRGKTGISPAIRAWPDLGQDIEMDEKPEK